MKTNPIHIPLMRGLRAVVCCGLASAQAWAATVVGRVNDVNTGASVTGAVVTDRASGRSVHADREGQFRLEDLPAGPLSLTISAIGYSDQAQSVEVPATGTVSVAIALGEKAMKMDALVVEGYREGWSKALQQKKNASNLKDILSSDAAGKLPDNNVGEALARLPGISLDVDYGEGHYVSVRGTAPNLNTVTMNGATLAQAPEGGTTRSAPMDLLGTSLISQVEVVKALTPDMDGTSLGGTINLLTPSGFDHQGQFIAGSVKYGENRAGSMPNYAADLTYTNIYPTSGGRLGLALSANYQRRQTRRDMYMGQWQVASNGTPYMYEPRLDYNVDKRTKRGASLNVDYRLDDGTQIYFRAFLNNFDERNDKNEQLYTGQGTATLLSDKKVSQPQVRADIRYISFSREARVTNLVFGGSKLLGDYKVSGEVTHSNATDDQPDYRNLSYRTGRVTVPGGFIIDYSSKYPTYDLTSLLKSINPDVRRVRGDVIDNKDEYNTVRGDIQRDIRDLLGGREGFIKVGVKYTDHDRNNRRDVDVYGAPGYKMSDFNTPPGPSPLWVMDGRYNLPISINTEVSRAMYTTLLSQGKLVRSDSDSLSNAGDDTYRVAEKITAVYGMFSVDLTPKATLLGGARFEQTKAPLNAKAFFLDPKTGAPTLAPRSVTYDYGEFLPNLQLRYTVSPSSIVRASITKTFGRPDYHDQVPSTVLDEVGGVLIAGNPELKPFESLNYDLSFEHYFKSGGMVSLAAFHKTIDNPIYTFSTRQQNVTYAGYFFTDFITSSQQNGQSAKLTGVELSTQVPFSAFLNGFADGFGVDANISLMDSTVKVFNRPNEELRLFASPKQVINIGLFYEKYGLSARVAYNYKTDALQEIGSRAYDDIYASDRYFLDAQVSYRFKNNYTLHVSWQNITDQTNDSYTAGSKDHLSKSYWYGSNIQAGLSFRF